MQRVTNCFDKLRCTEGLQQDALHTISAGADDGVVGVISEASHEDDWDIRHDLPRLREDLVATRVGQANIREDHGKSIVFMHAIERRKCLATVGAGHNHTAKFLKDGSDFSEQSCFIVDDQHSHASERRIGLDGMQFMLGVDDRSRARCAGRDAIGNIGHNSLQPICSGRVAFAYEGGRQVLQLGDGPLKFGTHASCDVLARRTSFDHQQVKYVQGRRNDGGVSLSEHLVSLGERVNRIGLDIEYADDLFVDEQGDSQRTLGVVETFPVQSIASDIATEIGLPCRSDPSRDAIASFAGRDRLTDSHRREVLGDDQFQALGSRRLQPDFEVIETEVSLDGRHDLFFELGEPLTDGRLGHEVPVQVQGWNRWGVGSVVSWYPGGFSCGPSSVHMRTPHQDLGNPTPWRAGDK